MGYSLDTASNDAPTYSHVKRIAIVGAGVAGLQLAERLQKVDGTHVTIFESTNKVGGVWSSNYADFGLQVPKELYEFPAFPYPKDKAWSRFPKGPEVHEYIEAFAAAFDLNALIRFNTTVVTAKPLEDERGWAVTTTTVGSSAITESFDFFVVATGMCTPPPTEAGGRQLSSAVPL